MRYVVKSEESNAQRELYLVAGDDGSIRLESNSWGILSIEPDGTLNLFSNIPKDNDDGFKVDKVGRITVKNVT
jgi:hypothetical protein